LRAYLGRIKGVNLKGPALHVVTEINPKALLQTADLDEANVTFSHYTTLSLTRIPPRVLEVALRWLLIYQRDFLDQKLIALSSCEAPETVCIGPIIGLVSRGGGKVSTEAGHITVLMKSDSYINLFLLPRYRWLHVSFSH
jgi:hypothetical protein